ncbi:MAG TPA: GspH/FimT family pseudopilin [Verrucomicrobiae bacterium]|nr:GspH/FimT family pseudopilin [Verrucomicrobiae bacterium]
MTTLQFERIRSAHGTSLVGRTAGRRAAFTLIELILILALLAIVTSLAAPSLSKFFRGRALSSEARQLLSLTHAGQSRAISEGFPVLLWIDSQAGEYGLQLEDASKAAGSIEPDPKAESFSHDSSLKLEAMDAAPISLNGRSVAAIRFLPDGTADEASPTQVRIMSATGETLWLMQYTNRLGYEIRAGQF